MEKERLEALIENETEWRRYMVKKVDGLEKDLNIFKIKAVGFIAVLSAFMELVKFKFLGK